LTGATKTYGARVAGGDVSFVAQPCQVTGFLGLATFYFAQFTPASLDVITT
jgi:hypothetical protein